MKRKLKRKLTKAEFDALSEELQDFYEQTAGKDDEYLLQADDAAELKGAVSKERRRADDAERLLMQVVPEIADPAQSDGMKKRSEWPALVKARADVRAELDEDGFKIEDYRAQRDADDGDPEKKRKPSELQQELAQAKTDLRAKDREIKRLEGEVKTHEATAKTAGERAKTLAREHAVDSFLDAARVREPRKRRVARLLIKERGIDVRETGDEEKPFEVLVKDDAGNQVLLEEYAVDWAEGDEGKEYAAAADNSGGGDGPESSRDAERPTRSGNEKDWENLSPRQQVEHGFRQQQGGGGTRRAATR